MIHIRKWMGYVRIKPRQLLIIPSLVLISIYSLARQSDSIGFKNDLKIFRKSLEETHPALYRFTSKERFDITFDSIDQQITNRTSQLHYFRLLSKVEALVREGHTYLRPSENLFRQVGQRKLFPFHVLINEQTLTLTKSIDTKNSVYEGSEMESINGKSVTEIIREIENSTGLKSGENNSALLDVLSFENNFALAYHLFIDTAEVFAVHLKGTATSIHIEGIKNPQGDSFPKFPAEARPPVHLQIDASNKTAVLKITTFAYWMVSSSKREYIKTFSNCFKQIEKEGIRNLIVDVRNNRGGEELLAAELLTYLIPTEFKMYRYMKAKTLDFNYHLPAATRFQFRVKDYIKTDSGYFKMKDEVLATFLPKKQYHFTGKIFMLSNGGSRSATSTLLALFQTHKIGIIIGQESGGVYEDVDGRKRVNLILPYSGIQLSFPAWGFKINSGNGNRLRGVTPDYIIGRSSLDSALNKDAGLEMAYQLISEL